MIQGETSQIQDIFKLRLQPGQEVAIF